MLGKVVLFPLISPLVFSHHCIPHRKLSTRSGSSPDCDPCILELLWSHPPLTRRSTIALRTRSSPPRLRFVYSPHGRRLTIYQNGRYLWVSHLSTARGTTRFSSGLYNYWGSESYETWRSVSYRWMIIRNCFKEKWTHWDLTCSSLSFKIFHLSDS